jgi:hypothetical protein
MSLRSRPIHCKFETLRLAGEHGRSSSPYNRAGLSVSLEQLSARSAGRGGRLVRPACSVTEGRL